MKSNYSIATRLTAILLTALILLPTAGCSNPEVVKDLQTARAVVDAASKILSASNPKVGSLLTRASVDLGLLETLITQYEATIAAGKPGVATQIQAVSASLQANLEQILAAVSVQNPELLEYIRVAVAIANSVVTIILARLPAAPQEAGQVRAQARTPNLPTVEFSTHGDLKQKWNDAVAANYPKAKI